MRLRSNSYYMLVSSLPALPTRFDVDRLPISRERLEHRLRLLEPEDAEEIERMSDVLKWSRQFTETEDASVVKRYVDLMQAVTNPLAHEVLTVGMDVRMIVTALRRRQRGLGPPPFGIGRWVEHIRRHFNQPDFSLGFVFPRLLRSVQLFEQGKALDLHRHLMGAIWDYLRKRADGYYFSFEAVVLYVARWNVMQQWQDLRAERGRPIFDALVKEALGEYANVYP